LQSRDDRELKKLGARLAGLQDRLREQEGPDRFEVGCRRFLGAAEGPRPASIRRASVSVFAGGALAAAAAVLLLWHSWSEPTVLSFTVGENHAPGVAEQWIAASARPTTLIRFSDGSRVSLKRGSRARVAALTAGGARLILESGRARVKVVHREGTSWQIDAGPFEVRVTGTAFMVDWSGEEQVFKLAMGEGSVLVDGPVLNRGSTLRKGQTLHVSVLESTAIVYGPDGSRQRRAGGVPVKTDKPVVSKSAGRDKREIRGVEPARPEGERVGGRPAGAAASSSIRAGGGRWAALADEGRYEEALQAADAEGFTPLCEKLGPADLLRLAEVARFAGRPGRAEQALVSLRQRFARGRHAAIAAYTLGRTAFDQQAEYGKAARWFETYIEEQPAGPLAREALGRLMEARQRAGQEEKARSAARDYLRRYPGGPHADIAARLAGE
jgi:transmembrane sensor